VLDLVGDGLSRADCSMYSLGLGADRSCWAYTGVDLEKTSRFSGNENIRRGSAVDSRCGALGDWNCGCGSSVLLLGFGVKSSVALYVS
jgi:hypothetical protein